jgi:hypothetical protein
LLFPLARSVCVYECRPALLCVYAWTYVCTYVCQTSGCHSTVQECSNFMVPPVDVCQSTRCNSTCIVTRDASCCPSHQTEYQDDCSVLTALIKLRGNRKASLRRVLLNTAAVTGCTGGYRLSMRYSFRARWHVKRDSLYMAYFTATFYYVHFRTSVSVCPLQWIAVSNVCTACSVVKRVTFYGITVLCWQTCIVLWSLCYWTRIHLCRRTEFRAPARLSCDSAQCNELGIHRTVSHCFTVNFNSHV